MSVLINMEMPKKKNGAVLIIYPDGRCAFENGKEYKAVPVPPHGRLIDADKVISDFEDGMEFIRSTCQNVEYKHLYCLIADGMIELLKKYRTVIPADKDGGT